MTLESWNAMTLVCVWVWAIVCGIMLAYERDAKFARVMFSISIILSVLLLITQLILW